jgi:hypothetical protein
MIESVKGAGIFLTLAVALFIYDIKQISLVMAILFILFVLFFVKNLFSMLSSKAYVQSLSETKSKE